MLDIPLLSKKAHSSAVEMAFVGDEQVIQNIWQKKDLLDKNDPKHREISPVVVLPGGGQRGAVSVGVAAALEKLDLVNSFDALIGSSTGAPIALYMLAGQVDMGRSIYWEENVKNEFAKKRRIKKVLDIDTLEQELRTGKKKVDITAALKARPELLIAATDEETGESIVFEAKKLANPLDAVIASINVPILNGGKTVEIDNRRFVDGDVGNPLPIDLALQHNATDILIVMTTPLELFPQLPVKILHMFQHVNYKKLSPGLLRRILSYTSRYNEALCYLRGEYPLPDGVRIAAIYPKHQGIGWFCMDADLLEEGSLIATEFTQDLFLQAKRKFEG